MEDLFLHEGGTMTATREELENELCDIYEARREGEKREEEILAEIRELDPGFQNFDIVKILQTPPSEQISSLNEDEEEKPYRDEVTGDPLSEHKAREEWERQGN